MGQEALVAFLRVVFHSPIRACSIPLKTKLAADLTPVRGRGPSRLPAAQRLGFLPRTCTHSRAPGSSSRTDVAAPCASHVFCMAFSSAKLLATVFFFSSPLPWPPTLPSLPPTPTACTNSRLIHAGPASDFCCCYCYCKH